MNSYSITRFEELIKNQEDCSKLAPVTTQAFFRIEQLEALIKRIQDHRSLKKLDTNSKGYTYFISVALVREKLEENKHCELFTEKNPHIDKQLEAHAQSNKKGLYTQLIPVIAGCFCELNEKNKTVKSVEWLANEKNEVMMLAPGGEGTGLIPPPPSTKG